MGIVKASNPAELNSIWRFSRLDINSINMTIKGQWIFNGAIDGTKMQESLSRLLNFYPHLSGRVQDGQQIIMNNEGVVFHIAEMNNLKISDIQNIKKPLDFFNPGLNTPDFIKGTVAPLSIQLTKLSDGTLLNVHCQHVCLDGQGFFKMMNDWAKLHNNQPIEEPVLSVNSTIFTQPYSKEEAMRLVVEKKWKQVGFKELLQFIRQKITKITDTVCEPIFLPDSLINTLRDNITKINGQKPSKHAVISALVNKLCYDLSEFKKPESFSQIIVMDIRERVDGIGSNYVGNAVTNIVTPDFQSDLQIPEIAAIIDETVRSYIGNKEKLEEHVKLFIASAENKMPFVPFNLAAMNSKRPTCIYINNQLKFNVYDFDFGCGRPIFAYPNDLPDQVKFWQSPPDKPGVNIYLGGYLAKRYKRIKEREKWISQFVAN